MRGRDLQAALTQKLDELLADLPPGSFRSSLVMVSKESVRFDNLDDDVKREQVLYGVAR